MSISFLQTRYMNVEDDSQKKKKKKSKLRVLLIDHEGPFNCME